MSAHRWVKWQISHGSAEVNKKNPKFVKKILIDRILHKIDIKGNSGVELFIKTGGPR